VIVYSSSVRAFLSLDSPRQSTTTDDDSDEAYSSQVRLSVYVTTSKPTLIIAIIII